MTRVDAVTRAYLAPASRRVTIGLEPSAAEILIARALSQGRTTNLTRNDTNPDALDSSSRWWREGLLCLLGRGLVKPVSVHADRVEWDWASPAAELNARRLVREDLHMPWAWLSDRNHTPAPPRLAELVAMLGWDMRFQGTRILDVDASNPVAVLVHEERLYGFSTDWESTTSQSVSGLEADWEVPTVPTFDWDAIDKFARLVSPTDPSDQAAGRANSLDGWSGPPRFHIQLRATVLTALRGHAQDLFGEPRLRINLVTWTVTRYGQTSPLWGEGLCAGTKDALLYLQAPQFATHEQFLRWAHRGGLHVTVPCGGPPLPGATTTLRIDPATGLVKTIAGRDTTTAAALETEHVLRALTNHDCVCTLAQNILETTEGADLVRTGRRAAGDPEWVTRARAVATVANGYAALRLASPQLCRDVSA